MEIDLNLLNISKFDDLTDGKFVNERLEFFKCRQCDLIVVGIPDRHIVLIDPFDLKKNMEYNLARIIKCPNCKAVWYHFIQDKGYKVDNVSLEELLSSNWKEVFSKK